MITEPQLRRIMPRLAPDKAQQFLAHLNAAMADFGIDNALRTAAFLAQLAHESGEFRWMEEIWGPTPAQKRYEPVSSLAARLGNTLAGDGRRFKGRGPIQITGRFNYRKYGDLLGEDLIGGPERAALPEVAFRVAGLYWKNRGLNELADDQDFKEITRRINGGFNGLADRQHYYERAKGVIAETGFVPTPATRSRRKVPVFSEPLDRGAEAIREDNTRRAPAKKSSAAGEALAAAAPAGLAPGKKAPGAKKAAGKTVAAKRAAVKKAPAKVASAKKPAAKKPAAKKTAAKKTAAKKAPPRRAPATKVAAKKAAAKKSAAKKSAAKKSPAKKAATRRR